MQPVFGDDHERFWLLVDDTFHFRPSMKPERWPGIDEPTDSITFSLRPILDKGPGGFEAGRGALNAEVLRALVTTFEPDEVLVALDWQHPSYWFRPHAHALTGGEWAVSAYPDGDYYLLFSQDLSIGTFGHPWEESICVIGEPLLELLGPVLGGWLPILRRGGT